MKAFASIILGLLAIGKCEDADEPAIPSCLHTRIEQIKSEDVWNPAATVWRITTTQNKTYYYIPQHCCDFFSELYDQDCKMLCAPDGGITGKGTGDCPDYEIKKKELIWKDKRGE
jgi:hypothetical protein